MAKNSMSVIVNHPCMTNNCFVAHFLLSGAHFNILFMHTKSVNLSFTVTFWENSLISEVRLNKKKKKQCI